MKRVFVLALVLDDGEEQEVVLGINSADPRDGHAWLVCNGTVVSERYDSTATGYTIVKRIKFGRK